MTVLRYPRKTLRNDFLRAAVGVAACAPLAAFTRGTSFGMWLFLALTALFLAFGVRTWLRARTGYRLTATGLVRTKAATGDGPEREPATRIDWSGLSGLKLRFFPLRRDRSDGWMQLTVRAGRVRLSIDSTLEGFDDIAAAALAAGVRNDLPMSRTTLANFRALGLEPERAAGDGAVDAPGGQAES